MKILIDIPVPEKSGLCGLCPLKMTPNNYTMTFCMAFGQPLQKTNLEGVFCRCPQCIAAEHP